jgi:hypothetical protein
MLELGRQTGLNAIGKKYKPVNNFLKPKPPKFNCGYPEDAHRFVRQLKDYFILLGLEDTEWLSNVAFCLEGTARRWYGLSHSDFTTYEDFVLQFVGSESPEDLYLRIYKKKQQAEEAFVDYAWEVYDLYQHLPTGITTTDAVIVSRIIENSHPTVRTHLRPT